MRAYQVEAFNGPDGLRLNAGRPDVAAGSGQILVKMRAGSLNFRDLMVVKGAYGSKTKTNVIPLSDGAGDVVAVGDGVTRFKVGDRVASSFFQDWIAGSIHGRTMESALGGALDGMLSEYAVLSEHGVIKIPDHLSYQEAACLPCAALTAWHALVDVGNLRAGQTVLVQGTGGVSLFALQFSKLMGASVILTSSSDAKLERAKALGADHLINYKTTPDWDKQVYKLTGGAGVDVVVEVGGAGTLEKSIRSVRLGGTIGLIGVLTGPHQIDPMPILWKSVRLNGIFVGSVAMFEAMNKAISVAKLHPVIDKVFGFEQVADAYRYLESGAHFGKIVIDFDKA
jgi:NADPH:quinone reductase-like Zn-dependent oxidoreductase